MVSVSPDVDREGASRPMLSSHHFHPTRVVSDEGNSKEYASKHEYLEEFVKPFGARFLASDRFRPTNIRSVHADGNTVIVLWDGRGIAVDGKPYENTYAFFMQMRDGKVVDVTALTDSISLNELLERVQPVAHVDS